MALGWVGKAQWKNPPTFCYLSNYFLTIVELLHFSRFSQKIGQLYGAHPRRLMRNMLAPKATSLLVQCTFKNVF